MKSKLHILILAAGASRRMRQAKQLIQIGGETLLEHSVRQASTSGLGPVSVVYGAYKEQIEKILINWSVTAIYNSKWEEGLGASIREGVAALTQNAQPDAILIALADQPQVEAELLQKLVDLYQQSEAPIASCSYEGTLGVPAVFAPSTYPLLQQLEGDKGAKSLLVQFRQKGALVIMDAPAAAVDLDTPEDLRNFLDLKNR